MKLFSNFTRTDRTILGVSIMVLLALSYLLYDDSLLFPRAKNGNLTPVGTLAALENDVRRKSNTDFVWLPGMKKDEIYNQDSIFTGDASRASIRLNDGSDIEIQENSLVNINVKNGQMQLDLRFGQLTGTGSSSIKVKTSTDEYTIEGKEGKFEVNRSAGGELAVKVLSGKAEIKGKKGRQNLKTNESLQISAKGIQKSEVEASIQLETKDNIYFHRKDPKEPLPLAWSAKGPIGQYQIEISKDSTFQALTTMQSANDTNVKISEPLADGAYFWRVKGLDTLRHVLATSKARKFTISSAVPPTITEPQQNATIQAVMLNSGAGLKTNFPIAWDAATDWTKYQLQLSDTADFTKVISDTNLAVKKTQSPSLPNGDYFARVRGFDKGNHVSDWSEVVAIHINLSGEAKPAAPKLLTTSIQFKIPATSERAPSAADSPKLEWKPVVEAIAYRWEIAQNPKFTGAKAFDATDTKTAWTQRVAGKHYFRVYAKSALGQLSDPSETGTMEIVGGAPVIGPIAPLVIKDSNPLATAKPKTVNVRWSAIGGASSYTLQMATTPEFNDAVEKQVRKMNSAAVELPSPGKYFIRLKATNESGQDISEYSTPALAIYDFSAMSKKPVLVEPENKLTVFLQKDSAPYVWLGWEPMQDAVAYDLEFATSPDFKQNLTHERMTETRYIIKTKLPYGPVYWRVRAIPKDVSLTGEWATWQFTLLQQENQGF